MSARDAKTVPLAKAEEPELGGAFETSSSPSMRPSFLAGKTSFSGKAVGAIQALASRSFLNDTDAAAARKEAEGQPQAGSSMLAPEAVHALQKNDPAALAFLQSYSGVILQITLFLLYVATDTAKSLTTKWAMATSGRIQASSNMIAQSVISFALGYVLILSDGGLAEATRALKDCFAIKLYAAAAIFMNIGAIFVIMSYSDLDAGLVKILQQLRLPLTALLSGTFLGKTYSFNKWMTLTICSLAVVVFWMGTEDRKMQALINKNDPDYIKMCSGGGGATGPVSPLCFPKPEMNSAKGAFFIITASVLMVIASLLLERTLKQTAKTPFYTQMMQREVTGVPTTIFMAFFIPLFIQGAFWDDSAADKVWWTSTTVECMNGDQNTVGGGGLFENWGIAAVAQLLTSTAAAWIGGIIIKNLSSVVKDLAKSITLIITVFGSEIFFKVCWEEPLKMSMYLLAAIAICASMIFSNLPNDAKPTPPPPAQQPGAVELREERA